MGSPQVIEMTVTSMFRLAASEKPCSLYRQECNTFTISKLTRILLNFISWTYIKNIVLFEASLYTYVFKVQIKQNTIFNEVFKTIYKKIISKCSDKS